MSEVTGIYVNKKLLEAAEARIAAALALCCPDPDCVHQFCFTADIHRALIGRTE